MFSIICQISLVIFLEKNRRCLDVSVYTTIKSIATDKKISIRKIEKDLSLANGVISHWDKSMPRADSLQMVADYLGVTSSFILNESRKEV